MTAIARQTREPEDPFYDQFLELIRSTLPDPIVIGDSTKVAYRGALTYREMRDNSTVVGFRAIAPGTAVVKVYDDAVENGGKKIKKVTITVNPS